MCLSLHAFADILTQTDCPDLSEVSPRYRDKRDTRDEESQSFDFCHSKLDLESILSPKVVDSSFRWNDIRAFRLVRPS